MKKTNFKLLAATLFLGTGLIAQTARVQVIHNSADAAAAQVDVYLGTTLLIDNFAFRTASPFINAPAGSAINIGIAPANSTNSSQAIANFPLTLTANATYVVVANGIVSASGYSPAQPFDLDIYALGREQSNLTGKTDVLVAHGSTDAPIVDVEAGSATLVDNIAYGAFNSYLELTTADYTINVTDQTGSTVVASYKAPLQTLGLVNKAIVVVASGFLNPANNSNGPAFGLWAALPTGGALVQLPSSKARVQVIHNSADAAAALVDVYLGTTKLIDDFAFRTASAFIDAPAETAQIIGIAPSTSTNSAQSIATFPVTLAADSTYIVVANGIVSATGYTPLPAFDLDIFASAREVASNSSNTDILVVHGSTDAPIVDIKSGTATLVNDIAYGSFAGYLSVPTANLPIDVANQAGTTIVASYSAPLSTLGLQGKAITVLASGFLTPANNSNGPAFGLWVALNTGGNLVPLPLTTSIEENNFVNSINVFPNPASEFVQVNFDLINSASVSIQLFDALGKEILNKQLGQLSPGNFNSSIDVLNLSSGLYNLSITTNDLRKNMKLSIVK